MITQSMKIQSSLQLGRAKADLAYTNAFNSLAKERIMGIFINFIKVIMFSILIPENIYIFNGQSNLIKCMAINLAVSIVGLTFAFVCMSLIFRSTTVFLNIADQTNHSIPDDRTTDLQNLQNCSSSTVFIAETSIGVNDINEQTKKLYENIAKNAITTALKARYAWYKTTDNMYSIISLGSMINSIYILATVDMSGATEGNLIAYVIIVGLSEFVLIVALLIVAITPIICIVLIFICCCCKTNPNQNLKFINVPLKDATMTDIVNAGGSCSICFQEFNVNEKIYVLLCSDKHVFHCECLRHWAKVKNTCPNCRQEIPMIDHQIAQANPDANPNPDSV